MEYSLVIKFFGRVEEFDGKDNPAFKLHFEDRSVSSNAKCNISQHDPGRLVLMNSSLVSLLMYLMGFYSLHESLHQEVAKYLSRFLWAGPDNRQKYHMVKWSEICKPKDQGGLGVISSKRMNIALLSKWL